jgi:hypothetical protein
MPSHYCKHIFEDYSVYPGFKPFGAPAELLYECTPCFKSMIDAAVLVLRMETAKICATRAKFAILLSLTDGLHRHLGLILRIPNLYKFT